MSEEQTDNRQHLRGCGPNAGKGTASSRLKSAHSKSERKMPLKEFAREQDTPDAANWMQRKGMKSR